MDTGKLFKAIQIVVKEEVKKQISTLKEEVRKEILAEMKTSTPAKPAKKSLRNIIDESADPFELANHILASDRGETRQFSKNPMVNTILNETATRQGFSRTDGEWGELPAESMLGARASGRVFQEEAGGEISTGNDILDKAIARSAKVLAASKDKNK